MDDNVLLESLRQITLIYIYIYVENVGNKIHQNRSESG